jgi:hypothetical protein
LPGQQPLALRPPWAEVANRAQPAVLWAALTGFPAGASLPPVLQQFDDVALVDPLSSLGGAREERAQLPGRCLQPIFATRTLRILAVRRGIGCAAAGKSSGKG